MTDDAPTLSIVIPAFNERGAIAEEVEGVRRVMDGTGLRYEIIVVDDGSTAGTEEIARALPCRVIRHARNRGYGAALKTGIEAAASELVLTTDADGTYPPEEIPRLLAAAPGHDMVVGARTGERVADPVLRRPAKWVLRCLAGYLAGRPIPDLNSGMRLLRRRDVRRFAHILPAGFSFTTTITLAFLCNDLAVAYVPIDYRRRTGTSKIRPIHAYVFLMLILRAVVLFNPLKVFLPIGAFLFLAGAAKFAYDVTKENLSESAVMGILAAIIVWGLGLLADQNARLNLDRGSFDRSR
jgi:glycosyltransferase involved in cell wall biosynthesis